MSADVTPVVGLRIEAHDGESLADKIVRAGQAKAISVFAAALEKQAKADLKAAAEADVVRAGGGGFSRTVEGVRATLTDPQPKPHVTDHDAFTDWWVMQGREHERREYVEVVDHKRALFYLTALDEGALPHDDDSSLRLSGCFAIRTEFLIPEGALDTLVKQATFVITDDGLVETATGELVPGVDCFRATPQVSVNPSKAAKARDAAIVASFFGLTPELGGGS